LSSKEESPETWRREPEAASASGGHLAPDMQSTGRFDPLTAPLPSEIDRRERERAAREGREPAPVERTEVIPARPAEPSPTRVAPGRRGRLIARRVKRTVRHVDPLSVLKVSLFVYASLLVLWLLFVVLLYSVLGGMGDKGLWREIELFFNAMEVDTPKLTLMYVEKWAFLIGVTLAVLGALVNTFVAFLFNIGADIIGGVDVTFVERDLG
jgi:transmembrane protein DUF3566